MNTFKKIVFPVDFSARSSATVPSVQAMVKRFGSELTVLHVVDLPPAAGIAPPEAGAWATLMSVERLRESGKISLDRFIAQEFPEMPVKGELAEGDPAAMIVDCARESGADLIMMPTSGLGRFRRLLLGSVTAKVLHDTAVPVWTGVHDADVAAHPPDRWKRMLCALDDDPRDLPVLQWAAGFAAEQNLELRLVHAVLSLKESDQDPSFREFIFNIARERMDELQDKAGTDFEVCLQAGKSGRVVHQSALGHCADLIVIGRGVIQKPFGRLRSGAYEIIRDAPCPVISV
jgi:nucleotide-binding universal stress UspA family protein